MTPFPKSRRLAHTGALALCAVATTLPAQGGMPNNGFVAPDTRYDQPGQPAPGQTNDSDRLFVRLLAAGNRAEVEAARMAIDKTRQNGIKSFSQTMISAHEAAGAQLGTLADKLKLTLSRQDKAEKDKERTALDRLDGRGFDLAYTRDQIVAHQKTLSLLQWELSTGQNADLMTFASKLLPEVASHLDMARELDRRLTGAEGGPRAEPPPNK